MKNSLYEFLVQNTGKEIVDKVKRAGIIEPIKDLDKFLSLCNLTWEKDVFDKIVLRCHSSNKQSIYFSFVWNKSSVSIEICITFENGIPKFDRFNKFINYLYKTMEVELYGQKYDFTIPMYEYSSLLNINFENENYSIETILEKEKSIFVSIEYWAGYYTDLFNSGKVVEVYNKLFSVNFDFSEGSIKHAFIHHVRYLVLFDKRDFEIPSVEELWILYYYGMCYDIFNDKNLNAFFISTKLIDLDEKQFKESMNALIIERQKRVISERLYIKIQKEFQLEILRVKQEISGKYGIDPGWLRVEISKDLEQKIPDLPCDFLKQNPYDSGYYNKFTKEDHDTREGLSNMINKLC